MERIVEFLSDLFLAIYKTLVDVIDFFLPSTPENLKIASLLSNLPTDSFIYYFVVECAAVVGTVIALIAIYKLVKILPFT